MSDGCDASFPVPQGRHPKHKGVSDPALLSPAERYLVAVMDVPRLRERLAACLRPHLRRGR